MAESGHWVQHLAQPVHFSAINSGTLKRTADISRMLDVAAGNSTDGRERVSDNIFASLVLNTDLVPEITLVANSASGFNACHGVWESGAATLHALHRPFLQGQAPELRQNHA